MRWSRSAYLYAVEWFICLFSRNFEYNVRRVTVPPHYPPPEYCSMHLLSLHGIVTELHCRALWPPMVRHNSFGLG